MCLYFLSDRMSLSLEKCSQPVIPVLEFLSHHLTKKLVIALIFDECFLQEALEKNSTNRSKPSTQYLSYFSLIK